MTEPPDVERLLRKRLDTAESSDGSGGVWTLDAGDGPTSATTGATTERRRRWGGVGATLLLLAAVAFVATRDSEPPPVATPVPSPSAIPSPSPSGGDLRSRLTIESV